MVYSISVYPISRYLKIIPFLSHFPPVISLPFAVEHGPFCSLIDLWQIFRFPPYSTSKRVWKGHNFHGFPGVSFAMIGARWGPSPRVPEALHGSSSQSPGQGLVLPSPQATTWGQNCCFWWHRDMLWICCGYCGWAISHALIKRITKGTSYMV